MVRRGWGAGFLFVLFFSRPLAFPTRHTGRGAGGYRRRRGRGSRGGPVAISHSGSSRALFLFAGIYSATVYRIACWRGAVSACGRSWAWCLFSRVWSFGEVEGGLDKGGWLDSGLGQRARHSSSVVGGRRARDKTVEGTLAVWCHTLFPHLEPLGKLGFDFVQGRLRRHCP